MKNIEYLLHNSPLPRLDTELLLAHVLHQSREFVVAHPEKSISLLQYCRYKRLEQKRHHQMPLAYLTGEKSFYGLDFFVNKYTLVPRPDTEILVEAVIQEILHTTEPVTLVDVGTGSGCIPISILSSLPPEKHPTKTYAIDISQQALKITKKNITKHHLSIKTLKGNLLQPFISSFHRLSTVDRRHLIITANLPYLTQEEIDHEPSIQQEPHLALYAEDNGLALYNILLDQITILLDEQKTSVSCYMEINDHQAEELQQIIGETFPTADITILKDLADQRRIVVMNI